jgi:phosphoribosyl-ATP pyrophosphohydrolase/phosphoribosyl-AMP cyclohydrolase
MMYENFDAGDIAFGSDCLVPAIAQDFLTKEVLMLAWMNREALEKTIGTGLAHYYSRSRSRLWLKGETSGCYQRVREILRDCDDDAILLLIDQTGGACHTGNRSCFYRNLAGQPAPDRDNIGDVFMSVQSVIEDRKANPREGSYTSYLFDKGLDKMLKKIGEESAEIIIAAKNPSDGDLVGEIADMIFHVSVVLAERGLSWRDVTSELARRKK